MSTVLIIGASRGIGIETVKLALKAGHSVRAMGQRAPYACAIPSFRNWMAMRLINTQSSKGLLWMPRPHILINGNRYCPDSASAVLTRARMGVCDPNWESIRLASVKC